jgi:hypothetical protein
MNAALSQALAAERQRDLLAEAQRARAAGPLPRPSRILSALSALTGRTRPRPGRTGAADLALGREPA